MRCGGKILYRNDNNQKYALLAALFAMLLFTLVSCGKQMAKLQGDAHDIAFRVYSRAGVDTGRMSEMKIEPAEAYILGITEGDFEENVEEACVYRPDELSAAESLCVVVAKNEPCAEELYAEMQNGYDWAPCDPAKTAVFMLCGRYILLAKSDEAGAGALSEAFTGETGGDAAVHFSQNPM